MLPCAMPRRLGQHFLRPASVEKLLNVVSPAHRDVFLEIGPGPGALTLPLAARAGRVVAVEVDARLAGALRAREIPNVTVVEEDALHADLRALVPAGSRLVGNLPYFISSPLLRRILDLHDHVRDVHVMLQAEVAERVSADPGGRDYGIYSVLFALWADVDVPLRFPRGAFRPPPRVDSALLRARFRASPRAPVEELAGFETFLKTAFARRRRTLENNLRDSYANLKDHLRLLNLEGSRRAETLSVVEFAALWRVLKAG
jgi:16S rRNA (adenine1518-N6/adenine1519-N6)-dimethyltransferase